MTEYEYIAFSMGLKAVAYRLFVPGLTEKKINILSKEIIEEIRPNTFIIRKEI
jgi:hypothetical protein